MTEYESELNSIHNDSINVIDSAYKETINKVAKLVAGISLVGMFSFKQNRRIDDVVTKEIASQFFGIQNAVSKNILSAFSISDKKIQKLTEGLFIRNNTPIVQFKFRDPNQAKSFINTKTDGLTFSQRIWNVSAQFKSELESAVSAAVEKGLTHEQVARSIEKYLNNPDMRFRRIRDKFGDLKPSQKALSYNPGQGIYRSSRQNAIRLAREVVNRGYREAEYENFKNNPYVTAFDIKNTEREVTTCKICEQNAGRYPKSFKFIGWHIGCMCISYPVFCSENEFIKIHNH